MQGTIIRLTVMPTELWIGEGNGAIRGFIVGILSNPLNLDTLVLGIVSGGLIGGF